MLDGLVEQKFKVDDFYLTNTVKCYPEENRKPTKKEKNACFNFLNSQILLAMLGRFQFDYSTIFSLYQNDVS